MNLTELKYKILDLPDDGPTISINQPTYNPGDILSANCTSNNSFPAAKLKWYINGQLALDKLKLRYPDLIEENGLRTSTLGLRFVDTRN